MSPMLLLILTFALSAGDAFETPTWRAVLPELVQKEDLAGGVGTQWHRIQFRPRRRSSAGRIGHRVHRRRRRVLRQYAFVLRRDRGRRPVEADPLKRATPPETISGATVAAIRYVRYSPAIRAVLFRAGAAMFFASGLLALLPSVAHRLSGSPLGYGVMLGCFGLGAVLGALVMQRARARWSADVVVSAGIAVFGLVTIAAGAANGLALLGVVIAGRRRGLDLVHLAFQCSGPESSAGLGASSRTRDFDACVSGRCRGGKRDMGSSRGTELASIQPCFGPALEQSQPLPWDCFSACRTQALI